MTLREEQIELYGLTPPTTLAVDCAGIIGDDPHLPAEILTREAAERKFSVAWCRGSEIPVIDEPGHLGDIDWTSIGDIAANQHLLDPWQKAVFMRLAASDPWWVARGPIRSLRAFFLPNLLCKIAITEPVGTKTKRPFCSIVTENLRYRGALRYPMSMTKNVRFSDIRCQEKAKELWISLRERLDFHNHDYHFLTLGAIQDISTREMPVKCTPATRSKFFEHTEKVRAYLAKARFFEKISSSVLGWFISEEVKPLSYLDNNWTPHIHMIVAVKKGSRFTPRYALFKDWKGEFPFAIHKRRINNEAAVRRVLVYCCKPIDIASAYTNDVRRSGGEERRQTYESMVGQMTVFTRMAERKRRTDCSGCLASVKKTHLKELSRAFTRVREIYKSVFFGMHVKSSSAMLPLEINPQAKKHSAFTEKILQVGVDYLRRINSQLKNDKDKYKIQTAEISKLCHGARSVRHTGRWDTDFRRTVTPRAPRLA